MPERVNIMFVKLRKKKQMHMNAVVQLKTLRMRYLLSSYWGKPLQLNRRMI